MKLKIFFIIVFIQIVCICVLLLKVLNTDTLGVSVNIIDSKKNLENIESSLKYYYEPQANSTIEIEEKWLPERILNSINNDTLHERFDYQAKKESKVFRIITIGDSFTYGQNVHTINNWTELLEDELNKKQLCTKVTKYEVINLGVYGYDIEYGVERYKIRGQKYNPDLVLWTFTDFERILEKMRPTIEKYRQQAESDQEKKGIFNTNWAIARKQIIDELGQKKILLYQQNQLKNLDDYYKGKLIYISLPNYEVYKDLLRQRIKERQKSYYFEPDIQWNQKQYFLEDNHFNNYGNSKMMTEVYDYLVRKNIIPCS